MNLISLKGDTMFDPEAFASRIYERIAGNINDYGSSIFRCRFNQGFYGWASVREAEGIPTNAIELLDIALNSSGLALDRLNPWTRDGIVRYRIIDYWKDPLKKW